ncbi:integrin beta-1-binding protein 2 isoform X1 [Marmota flaviventris]|uniref:integrin beta-1-binding protein 2 isoform X1 n=1 Tax=Marmota flaviventris TaxID=93162 RepID=UPI003A86464B
MSLLCHNKGCGQQFDPSTNLSDSCRYHPGVPIFHDALKGWSCCRKRTVDFSEFLNIKGCTMGPHCAEKLPEAPQPEGPATSSLQEQRPLNTIPKSEETLLRERPKSELPPKLLPLNVSQALEMALEQKELDQEPGAGLDSSLIRTGSSCQNPGCDAVYQGPESDATPCTYHPGAPRFHEGMKSWSCCGIQTLDFGAFLAQPGCRVGRHDWGKQLPASCRHDWHQTDSLVVVTVYGQIPLPAFNWVKASQTELHIHIVFDGNRVFQAQMKLWGVSEEKGTKVGETDGVKEGPDGMKKGYPEGRSCSGKVEIFLFICFHIPSLFPPFPFPLPPPSFSLLLFLSSLSPFFIFLSSLITTLPQSFWFLRSLFFLCSSVSFPPS